MKKIFFTLFLFLSFALNGIGQEISFEASAPESVAVGQQFRLTFTVNAEASDFKMPNEINGFDVVYGPSTSSSYSSSVVGGKTETKVAYSYTYILQAKKEGTFTIPEASIKVDGKIFKSKELKIKVTSEGKIPQNEQSSEPYSTNDDNIPDNSSPGEVRDSDAFIQTVVSKTQVCEQESFAVTYKLYTKLNVAGIRKIQDAKLDEFDVEDVDVANEQFQTETYNGEKYYTATVRKLLLTPHQKGNLEIPQSKFRIIFQVPTGRTSFFGEQEVANVGKDFTTQSAKIKVTPLPSGKPSDFSNVVGNLTMTSSISTTRAKVGKAVLIRIVISGSGNTTRISTPKIHLPESFNANRPQVSQSVDIAGGELIGTKTIEYLFVPNETGDYKIPSVSVTYFDTETNTYKTLSTQEFNLNVEKGATESSGGIFV